MDWLKKRREELLAQVNPFDGGKTASTVRAERAKVPPAQTVSRQSLGNKVRDVFDANTQADQQRRIAQGKPAQYKDEVAQRKGFIPKLYGQQQVGLQNDVGTLRQQWKTGESKPGALTEFLMNRTKGAVLGVPGMVATGISGSANRYKPANDALQGLGTGIMNTSLPRVVGGGLEYTGRALGNTGLTKRGESISNPFREYNNEAYNNANNKALFQGTQMAGTLLGSSVNPAGKAGVVTNALRFGLPAAGDTSKAIQDSGGSRTQQTIGGGVSGIAQGVMGNLLKGRGTGVTKLVTSAGAGGTENVGQQFIDNLIAQKTYQQDRKLNEGLGTAFVTGSAVSGATNVPSVLRRKTTPQRTPIDYSDKQNNRLQAQRAYDVETNPVLKRQISEYIAKLNQSGTLGDAGNTPTVKNVFGEEVPNPNYKDPLEPLRQEARKYKSAEEFVNSYKSKSPEYAVGEGSGHTAPLRDEYNAPAHELTKIYPKDIYENGARYYGSGYDQLDAEVMPILNRIKNNPDAEVTIYRAVPKNKGIKDFNKGDWVTLTKGYAKEHGESNLGGNYEILSKKVKADEVFTDANSLQEFGYDPRPKYSDNELTDLYNEATKPSRFSLNQGGYINPKAMMDDLKGKRTNKTGIKNYNPDGLPKPANDLVHQYAKMLESTGSGMGVSIVDGKRISNNSPAYRELFAQLGRKPTTRDWYDYAYNEINNGKAPKEITTQFEQTLNSELMTDKQIQAPEALNPQGSTPIKNKPSDMPMSDWESLIRTRVPDERKVDVVNQDGKLAIQKKTVAPLSKQETVQETIQTDAVPQTKAKVEKDFDKSTNQYLGSIQSAETTARMMADDLPFKLKGQDAIDAIVARDNGIQTGRKEIDAVNNTIQNIYDNLYAQYRDAGFDMGYVDNYSPRIYKNPKTGEAVTKDEYLYLTRTPGQTISRTAQNVNPDDLLYKTPQELLGHYVKTFERAKAGRQYFDTLKNQGYIVEAGTRPDGMVVIDAPGMPQPQAREIDGVQYQGNYYAYPDVAKKINKVFGVDKGNRFLGATARLSSAAQDIGLSGGIPGTPVNAFTFAQMTKELTAGKVRAPFKALWNARSSKGAQKYFKDNAQVVSEMQKQGIAVTSEYNMKTLDGIGKQIDRTETYGAKAGVMWDKVMSDPTFRRFMPSLQVETYKQIKNKYAPKLGEEKASEIAGNVVKNFYGLTDLTTQATRSKTANDLWTTTLFAPKYRESMARFWVNNAKAIDPRKWTNPEYAMNVRFNVGATLLFGAMQAANIALNGNPTWENPDGKKDKLIIPADKVPFNTNGKDVGIPFLSSIATVPRAIGGAIAGAVTGNPEEVGKSAKSFLSYGLRPLVDVATNENYFGDKIYDPNAPTGERVGSQASYLAKAFMHPYMREGLNIASNKLPEDVKKFVGAKEQTPFETASKALETPLRFYDPNYYEGGSNNFQARTRNVDQQSNIAALEKTQKEQTKTFEKSFSKDDLKLFKLSKDEREQLVQSGTVDQQKLDDLDRYALQKRKELGMKPGTIGQKIPEKIENTDDKVKEFYNDRAYIHDTDYEDWQSKAPESDSGKDMIRRVNQLVPEGLPQLPQTNKTAEMYAEFKKEQANNNWSESYTNKKKLELLRNVYKTGLDKEQSFYLSSAVSDDDIRADIDNGSINKEMMDKLVSMDDLLVTLGGSAMIGKTLRKDYGYGSAPTKSSTSKSSKSKKYDIFAGIKPSSISSDIYSLIRNARV